MRQAEIDRAVARATGEPMELVRGMGFNIIPMPRVVCLPIPRRQMRQATRRRHRPRILSAAAAVS